MATGGNDSVNAVEVTDRALDMAGVILRCKSRLMDALTTVATWESAHDEVARSVRALAGATWEINRYRPERAAKVGVFMPSNNVLYSYVLYGLVPSLYADLVLLRPSSRVGAVTRAVHEIITTELPNENVRTQLSHLTQRNFIRECGSADAVVFTGQYRNALDVMLALGDGPLFLMFGSGPNPLVAGPEADPLRTARAMLAARLYNSGQDCLCSDVMFVHQSVLDAVLAHLKALLDGVRTGDRRLPGTVVAPLVYPDAFAAAQEFLGAHADAVVYGRGGAAVELSIPPTVLLFERHQDFHPHELFAPVFCLVPYADPDFIVGWAQSAAESERGMYITVIGEPRLPAIRIGTSVVIAGASPLDLEDGNQPFGGYGHQASAIRVDGRLRGRPLLLSEALASRPVPVTAAGRGHRG